MNIFVGSIEVQMLLWSVVLGLVHLIVATSLSNKDRGLAYNISSRDDTPPAPLSKLTARLLRAFENFKETYVFFVIVVLVVALMARQNQMSAIGAQLYFWARVVYIPVYAAGINVLRTVIWTLSLVGMLMVLSAAIT